MQRSRTALSVRYCRELAAHNRHATHTATPESSNPHNVAPVPRGFVLGRFPYAGPVPRRATFEARRPKTFTKADMRRTNRDGLVWLELAGSGMAASENAAADSCRSEAVINASPGASSDAGPRAGLQAELAYGLI